jgi:hypothetical protein
MQTKNTQFPKYYRRAGKCIKVVSATETRTIILPPESMVPERYTTRYPSKERLEKDLENFEECDEKKFKEFLFSFYQRVADERQLANQIFEQSLKPNNQSI